MFQRMDASRVVFNSNKKSSVAEKPASGFALPQSRNPNLRLRTINPTEQANHSQNRIGVSKPSADRRMSRRRVQSNILSFEAVPQQDETPFEVQRFTETDNLQNMFFGSPATETLLPEQAYEPGVHHHNAPPNSFLSPVAQSSLEKEETEESYSIDRPVFLLSQKYFGTRF